ncbi:Cytochrome p450 [Neofusicoccum parvum]|uniref:Cytochrome p450 n=1 Tax=Neofusicoccum parvum TaxID=310453 RepID=A0ACB5SC41_9PEZI|nr:Cytochrome p450 [Neofusicoccum parvum]
MVLPIILTALVLLVGAFWFAQEKPLKGLPILDFEDCNFHRAQLRFIANGRDLLWRGLKQFSGPFQVITPVGAKVMLPGRFASEIKNDSRLSFGEWLAREFDSHLSGFEGFRRVHADGVFVEVVRGKLTQALGSITDIVCDESRSCLHNGLGESKEWTEITLKPFITYTLARLSTRVFLGPELCRNDEWLDVFINFVTYAFSAMQRLRTWHPWLRPIANVFLPESRKLRQEIAHARRLIEPLIDQRRRENSNDSGKARGTIDWMDQVAKGRSYDPVMTQLFFSLFAVHTTTELVTNVMYDICAHPEYIEPLRDEIEGVLRAEGWKKTSLFNMKFLDSFLNEVQRLSPGGSVAMNRVAFEEIQLSDGSVIPKGATLSCTFDELMNPAIYPEPEKFDPYRFLKKRQQPGQENSHQFVTTSQEHLAFGLGTHACPGRFFAANESKVLICHLLLMYDWKLADEAAGRPDHITSSEMMSANPFAKVMFKRREQSAL